MAGALFFIAVIRIILTNIGLVEGILTQDVACRPRKVLIPIDAPRYQYFPRFVEVFRCNGACSTHSPNLQHCRAVAWNNISDDIYDLAAGNLVAAAFENHTSCQCECVAREEDCSENEKFEPELCDCQCEYDDTPPSPCPERFIWSPFECKCVCRGPVLFCPPRQEWSYPSCGCVCTRTSVESCKYQKKYLNATTCKCEEQAPINSGPGDTGRRSASEEMDGKRVAAIMIAELIVLVFLFDLYLFWRYKKGCIHWIIGRCRSSPKAPASESASLANTNNGAANGTGSKCNVRPGDALTRERDLKAENEV